MGLRLAASAAYMAAVVVATLLSPVAAANVQAASGPDAAAEAAKILGLTPFPKPVDQSSASDDSLMIHLGYGIYQGYYNKTADLNIWKGIRFASPPRGELRWQTPRLPSTNTTVVYANDYPPICPQSPPGVPHFNFLRGDEDCLYLNVFAPPVEAANASNATSAPSSKAKTKRPVLVWIHGGGWGMGNGQWDMSGIINDNDKEFVVVSIQYRLGAFGFLSSADVKANGIVNAGLLDQAYALMWVQNYIGLFGGDARRVTIAGESAGGGAIMYHVLGNGGASKLNLFRNGIAASPYLVPQYKFDAPEPTRRYNDFAKAAGCNGTDNVFNCLVAADSLTLQHASANVSDAQLFSTWAFVPVTDGAYVQEPASQQLARKAVNGVTLMVGNNADEGSAFVPRNISSNADLERYIRTTWSGLSDANVTALLAAYSTGGVNSSTTYGYPLTGPKFETNGISPPTASDVSQQAIGPQQRAFNMYAEATFVCPAYWLAAAFTPDAPSNKTNSTTILTTKRAAFQYQYSVPFASHGADVAGYIGPPTANQGPNFVTAFRRIWGGLVVRDDPSIKDAAVPTPFPAWTPTNHTLLNLNQTGGVLVRVNDSFGGPSLQLHEPGLVNDLKTANAETWEGGRGARCDFWKSIAPFVPQ